MSVSTRRFASCPAAFLLALTLGVLGCGEDGLVDIAPPGIAGDYEAEVLFVTAPDHTRDLLADGATLELTLSTGFALFGRLHIPEAHGEPELERDIRGTWSYDPVGRAVRFDEQVETFLSEIRLRNLGTQEEPRLVGTLLQPEERLNHSSPITQIDVTLVKKVPDRG